MGVLDVDAKATAADIAAFGQLVTWLQPPDATFTESGEPWVLDADTPSMSYSVSILWTPEKAATRYANRDLMTATGDDLPRSIKAGIMAGWQLPFIPGHRDAVQLPDGTTYYLTAYSTLATDGNVILYYLTLEAGR